MDNMRAGLVGALVTCCAACGGAYIDGRAPIGEARSVTDGRLASADEVGATVSLVFSFMGESGCTGTLIAPRVVATAAHCVVDVSASDLEVVVGATVPAEADDTQVHVVSSATAHPEFRNSGYPTDDPAGLSDERDIGVLVLAEEVTNVEPARVLLPNSFDEALIEGDELVITGYGQTAEGWDADYGRLYIASTPYVRRSEAELLAGGPGTPDTCYGDSGGPAYAVVDGVRHLAGITSRGANLGDGTCGSGGIYTLFGAYAAFVEEVSGGLWTALPDAPEPDGDGDDDGDDDVPGDPPQDDDTDVPDPFAPDDDDGTPNADDEPSTDADAEDPESCAAAGAPAPLTLVVALLAGARFRRRT